jgi:hypothetical protein
MILQVRNRQDFAKVEPIAVQVGDHHHLVTLVWRQGDDVSLTRGADAIRLCRAAAKGDYLVRNGAGNGHGSPAQSPSWSA